MSRIAPAEREKEILKKKEFIKLKHRPKFYYPDFRKEIP